MSMVYIFEILSHSLLYTCFITEQICLGSTAPYTHNAVCIICLFVKILSHCYFYGYMFEILSKPQYCLWKQIKFKKKMHYLLTEMININCISEISKLKLRL